MFWSEYTNPSANQSRLASPPFRVKTSAFTSYGDVFFNITVCFPSLVMRTTIAFVFFRPFASFNAALLFHLAPLKIVSPPRVQDDHRSVDDAAKSRSRRRHRIVLRLARSDLWQAYRYLASRFDRRDWSSDVFSWLAHCLFSFCLASSSFTSSSAKTRPHCCATKSPASNVKSTPFL